MNILSSFTLYTAALHALILSSLLLAHLWLGLSWIDYISANKRFSSPKTSSRKPYTYSKQQERQKHSAETTINFSDFLEVAKKAKAKPRQLHLRKSGPSSDVESAQRGRMPPNQASSSSNVPPDQRDVACACERACGVPCNLRVAQQRATEQNAAVEGAVGIAQQEAADWGRGMAFHASAVAAIAARVTAAVAQDAAAARVRSEVAAAGQEAAATQEARLAQEAIARKEPEVKALEEALAQERARKEAEEGVHAEATAKAKADAARKDAMGAARRKVAEERAKTEAELAALEAEKARLQRAREAEDARAREEADWRAAAATAAAMEEAEAKLQRETPPGGSRVETLRKLFEGDASSKMKLDLEEDDTGSSGDGGPTAYQRRRGKGKTAERARRPAGGHPHDSDPFFTASDGDGRDRRHHQGMAGGGGGHVPMEPEGGGEDLPPPYRSAGSTACDTETARSGNMSEGDDMDFSYTVKSPSSDPPRRPAEAHQDPLVEARRDPQVEDPLEDVRQVNPREADPLAGKDPLGRVGLAEALLEDPLGTPMTRQGMESQRPPAGGSSTSARGFRPSSAR